MQVVNVISRIEKHDIHEFERGKSKLVTKSIGGTRTDFDCALDVKIRQSWRSCWWALAGFLWSLGLAGCANYSKTSQENASAAKMLFAERCKTAGEKIYRTIEDVAGIYLLKIRSKTINYGEQYSLDDPYGSDFGGGAYIDSFLKGFFPKPLNPSPYAAPHIGYEYVDATDPGDGVRYRYTGRIEEPWQVDKRYLKGYTRFVHDKTLSMGPPPRYAVTYDDISTHEEREKWIAGSSLKVIDLQTGDVIAERVGYMIDVYQGSRVGGRAPWLLAANNSCPKFSGQHAFSDQIGQAERFVEKVLRSKID
jgi:hypothetical protein